MEAFPQALRGPQRAAFDDNRHPTFHKPFSPKHIPSSVTATPSAGLGIRGPRMCYNLSTGGQLHKIWSTQAMGVGHVESPCHLHESCQDSSHYHTGGFHPKAERNSQEHSLQRTEGKFFPNAVERCWVWQSTLTKQLEEERVNFDPGVEVTVTQVGKLGQQMFVSAEPTAITVKTLRSTNECWCSTHFPFSYSLGSQPGEWCHPQWSSHIS